jgi:hypothetical protein
MSAWVTFGASVSGTGVWLTSRETGETIEVDDDQCVKDWANHVPGTAERIMDLPLAAQRHIFVGLASTPPGTSTCWDCGLTRRRNG